jgi:hypothetical protein
MEMKPAQKIQYRHKLSGDDVRNWQPLTWRAFWFPTVMLFAATLFLLLVDALWM